MYAESELILNPDGSVYHLNLLPEELADTVIFVGDPDRVDKVSCHFDEISVRKKKREFVIHSGRIGRLPITVMSTGMGTCNIEIVLNELDALARIDLDKRTELSEGRSLRIVRIGTSGSMRPEVPLNSHVISNFGIGLDGILNYYDKQTAYPDEEGLLEALNQVLNPEGSLSRPYLGKSSEALIKLLSVEGTVLANTATCLGFYAPQSRFLRLGGRVEDYLDRVQSFDYNGFRMGNFEMETAAILEFSARLGHQACSASAIVASRFDGKFSTDPYKVVDELIVKVLDALSAT